jgi:Pentapeptide repeats (8 copies)
LRLPIYASESSPRRKLQIGFANFAELKLLLSSQLLFATTADDPDSTGLKELSMILHEARKRPERWKALRSHVKHRWAVPFVAFEWVWEWAAFGLANWRFLEVLEYLGSFSVLVGVIFYYSESGDRIKQRHYQAWQVINTAQGKGGSGGRIEALQELNEDKVPLVGVDVSSAFLQGLKLKNASLVRADFSASDLRGSDLQAVDFTDADLHSANFRGANLEESNFSEANMADADLWGSSLAGATLDNTNLGGADLRNANLHNIHWQKIKNIKMANLAGVKNAPEGFILWALEQGAVQADTDES